MGSREAKREWLGRRGESALGKAGKTLRDYRFRLCANNRTTAQNAVNAQANGRYMPIQYQVKGSIRSTMPARAKSMLLYTLDFSKTRE